MTDRYCNRCNDKLNRPHTSNANYIRASDFTEKEPREITYGMKHTEESKKRLDEVDTAIPEKSRETLAAEIAHPEAPGTVEVNDGTEVVDNTETVSKTEINFSFPTKDFDHIRLDSPEEGVEDDEIALAYSNVEKVDVQKTGLVCLDCLKDSDEIIWGADE